MKGELLKISRRMFVQVNLAEDCERFQYSWINLTEDLRDSDHS